MRLRPVREQDLARFAAFDQDADPWNFFGFRSERDLAQRYAENGLLSDVAGVLVVALGEEFIGDVSWHRQRYGPEAASALNIGVQLLPAYRSQGLGTQAHRLLCDYCFATFLVHRIEACTDVENVAEQRALVKAGFLREGVLRGAQWRAGAWHDLVLFSRLRTDAAG